jgi:hypothetical protein
MDTTNPVTPSTSEVASSGSKDGSSAADHDEPYRFGLRPTAKAPFPFTERQFVRLLIMRSHISERAAAATDETVA